MVYDSEVASCLLVVWSEYLIVKAASFLHMQPALGGDAKTLMFVNVAPSPAAAPESLCSLRFASKVHICTYLLAVRHCLTQLNCMHRIGYPEDFLSTLCGAGECMRSGHCTQSSGREQMTLLPSARAGSIVPTARVWWHSTSLDLVSLLS